MEKIKTTGKKEEILGDFEKYKSAENKYKFVDDFFNLYTDEPGKLFKCKVKNLFSDFLYNEDLQNKIKDNNLEDELVTIQAKKENNSKKIVILYKNKEIYSLYPLNNPSGVTDFSIIDVTRFRKR